MNFNAIDLSRLTPHDLRFQPRPISEWPTVQIDVGKMKTETCIASWRWDVRSSDEISEKLSECAWDALHLGFSFLLCDIVSLPQTDSQIAEKLITFSELYKTLPVVIAYAVDDDIKRPWIRNEAYKILESPTKLAYVYHKWKLRIPLLFSLVINQICTRRLGISTINTAKLPLCDRVEAGEMTLRDLCLLEGIGFSLQHVSISLDRRRQTYASDVLLVYELNLSLSRVELIRKLRDLKSNSVIVPALCAIWAMINGLSVSVRGCDWNIDEVVWWMRQMLCEACKRVNTGATFNASEDAGCFLITGAIKAQARPEIEAPPRGLPGPRNFILRCLGEPARAADSALPSQFLVQCVNFGEQALKLRKVSEPEPLGMNSPGYELEFDSYVGPCSQRPLPWANPDS